MNRRIRMVFASCIAGLLPIACASDGDRQPTRVYLEPWQMVEPDSLEIGMMSTSEVSSHDNVDADSRPSRPAKPIMRPNATDGVEQSGEDVGPEEAIETARRDATQQPTPEGFIDAVQLYDFEAGALYDVLTAPGFVTVLRLRPGEQITQLAAGDTSRWLIDTIESGLVDPPGLLDDKIFPQPADKTATRMLVLIKPRRPSIETNLVISTSERTYLVQLKSVATGAYHSVIEWTYPKNPTSYAKRSAAGPGEYRANPIRNYTYVVKVEDDDAPPPWTPARVFDDGHRVYIEFADSISDVPRPPLFIVGARGSLRLVNYQVQEQAYIVHELFDKAELRFGEESVVIERLKPSRGNILTWTLQLLFGD